MNDNVNDTPEIDIFKLLSMLWENVLVIILTAAVFGGAMLGYTYFRVTPRYSASTTLYVNSSSFSIGSTSFSVSSSSMSSSQLVDTYILVLNSRTTIEEVIEEAGLNYSYGYVLGMISTKSISGTSAFTVNVSCTSATEAELIANTIAKVLPERISEIIYGSSVQVIDYAIVPSSPSYPNYTTSTIKGALVGAVLSAALILGWGFLKGLISAEISSSDQLRQMYPDIPVFAVIPDIRQVKGKGYVYSYYGSDDKKSGKSGKNEAKQA